MDVPQIGSRLAKAAGLELEPLCVGSLDDVPEEAMPLTSIDRCVARAIYKLARKRGPAAYISEGSLKGCCPGGQSWLGYRPFAPKLKHFISQGAEDFMGGRAEHLKRDPEMVDGSWEKVGKVTALAENTVIAPCHMASEEAESIILFGTAEQVRNLSSLVHFGTDDVFGAVIAPWGPACAQMITYAAGLAEHAPKGKAFLGSMDPTVNPWLPRDMMYISLPFGLARRMCDDLPTSFLMRHPETAMPSDRERV